MNFKNVRVKGKVQKCKNVKVKSPYSQRYGFSSNHIQVWELDHKEGWVPKNWCFWTMVLEKTLEGPLDSKDIKLINPKVSQPWIFIGKTDVEFEAPILWSPDVEPTHWKRPWCWERLKARGKGGNRGRDDWMASLTQWTWVWANYGRYWRTGKLRHATVHGVSKSQAGLSNWTTSKLLQ